MSAEPDMSVDVHEETQRELEILRILVQGEIDIQAGVGYDIDVVMAEADALARSAEPAQDERDFMRAVDTGLADIEAGRVMPRDEVVRSLGMERHASAEGDLRWHGGE